MESQNLFQAGPSSSWEVMELIYRHKLAIKLPQIVQGVAYLFKCSVGEPQHVNHAHNLARFIHDGQIQVMTIWLVVSLQIELVR